MVPLNRKGAVELSIGTIVVIVLAMSMLILGLVLVRTIFTGATENVDQLNDKVKGAISSLFAEEGDDVIVKLGADKTAKVKPNSGPFGIAIGARTLDGSAATRDRLKYKLTLDTSSGENCVKKLGLQTTKSLFSTSMDEFLNFDDYKGSQEFARVLINVPKGTAQCSQKVLIDVVDTQNANQAVGGSFFVLEIIQEGFFS